LLSLHLLGWSYHDTDADKSEKEIIGATRLLMEEAIPYLARQLDQVDISDFMASISKDQVTLWPSDILIIFVPTNVVMEQVPNVQIAFARLSKEVNIVNRMHSCGINMRHLGR